MRTQTNLITNGLYSNSCKYKNALKILQYILVLTIYNIYIDYIKEGYTFEVEYNLFHKKVYVRDNVKKIY